MKVEQTNPPGTESSFYIAVIVYVSSSDAPSYVPLYEECFTLITATSQEEANGKALRYAQREQGSFLNELGETITWSLKEIVEVTPVLYDEFADETDLYARYFRNYEAYHRAFAPILSSEGL